MYKSRLWIWVVVILFAGGIKLFPKVISSLPESHTYNVYLDVSDNETRSKATDTSYVTKSNFNVSYSINGSDLIIKDHEEASSIDGYKKYEKCLSSPIVMYAQDTNSSYSGFRTTNSNETAPVDKDFLVILDAVENGKTYGEIGLGNLKEDEPVKLMIPNRSLPSYHAVEDLFYAALNNGVMPDEQRRAELAERVESLMGKCIQSDSVKTKINEAFEMKDRKNPKDTLFIDTESICLYSSTAFDPSSQYTDKVYYPVYTIPSTAVYYDVFIRENLATEQPETKVKDADYIFSQFADSNFADMIGLRINGSFSCGGSVINQIQTVN